MKEKFLSITKEVLLYIWQLPQNILGLLFLLFIKGEERKTTDNITFYYCKNFRGGISLGKYIILNSCNKTTVRHEYGHCIQSKMLGWLYLIVIGLPSLIHAGIHKYNCSPSKSYYHFYTEKWADKLMGIKR